MKKYELLADDTIEFYGRTLHRIKACKDFGNVKSGELGGYIESENNLSQAGDCWVCDNARVCGNAWVYGNAWVCGNARVYGNAWVCGNARVYDSARVCGNAWVYGNAEIKRIQDVLVVGRIGSRNDFTTFFRKKDGGISVKCGCFCGTIDEFTEKVSETHGDNKHGRVYHKCAELAKIQILEDVQDE